MSSSPPPVTRALREVGINLATQRKLLGLTAQMVAQRAGISQPTLSKLERGEGTTLDIALRVLRVLGLMDAVVQATDPYETPRGRLMAGESLPIRVRAPRRD